jgi:hypothetical protein
MSPRDSGSQGKAAAALRVAALRVAKYGRW